MKKEQFKTLYNYCQSLPLHISRGKITPEVVRITGEVVRTFWTKSLDDKKIRGFFIGAKSKSHIFPTMFGSNVIVLSDKLKENKCWQRFIYTKELMHMFDSDEDSMSISDEFVELLSDLSTPTQEICSQTQSDFRGFWMALACLCPENCSVGTN